jgi:hypothetical protein
MSASEAPIRRLLFVADAALAEVHDLPPEAVEDLRFGLPLISYAVDSRGHATGAQRR